MTLGMTQRRSQSCFVALLAIGVLLDPLRPVFVLAQSPAEFDSVTDAMLQNPDPADWLNWRRTLDGWGYSPLDESQQVQRPPTPTHLGVEPSPGTKHAHTSRVPGVLCTCRSQEVA